MPLLAAAFGFIIAVLLLGFYAGLCMIFGWAMLSSTVMTGVLIVSSVGAVIVAGVLWLLLEMRVLK